METIPHTARVRELLNAYATDVIGLEDRICELAAERDRFREIAVVAFDALRQLTQRADHWRAAYYDMRDQREALILEQRLRSVPDEELATV
jgi:hypothetical protein